MKEKKRLPIRRRVQRVVLLTSIISLLLISMAGLFSMLRIRHLAEDSLTFREMQNVSDLAYSKAELADSELAAFAHTVDHLADYIHGLYAEPERYNGREVLPPSAANAGSFVMQRGFLSEEITLEDVREELELLGNAEAVFRPIMTDDAAMVSTIYMGTESGLMISYDAGSDVAGNEEGSEIYYNYKEQMWYQQVIAADKAVFTSVYSDSYGQGLMITCGAPFLNAKGEKAGVICMDIHLSDLYAQVVSMDLGEGAFAFLVDDQGHMISPSASDEDIFENPDIDETVREGILTRASGVKHSASGVYFALAPVEVVPWMLCVHMPQSLIFAPIRQINAEIRPFVFLFLGVVILLLVLVTAIGTRLSTSLTEPLIALSQDVREISGGDLDYRAKVFGNDEIGDLAVEFNDMAASLKEHIANLTRVTAEKERIGAELNVATQIQADMLPRIFPPFPNRNEFDIFASMAPAKEVGGDFYDFFLIDEDHLGLVMADVSGKGVPAALFMVIAKTLIKNRAMMGGGPGEILENVNDQLCEGNEAGLFITVWLGILEISTGRGLAANAGHEHPAIRRKDGRYELIVYHHSPAVATMEGLPFREHSFELHPGDELFVYTDGVPEATNAAEEMFGTDRMLEALNASLDKAPQEQLAAVNEAIGNFVGDAPQFDDTTMLSLHYRGPKK